MKFQILEPVLTLNIFITSNLALLAAAVEATVNVMALDTVMTIGVKILTAQLSFIQVSSIDN